MGSELASSSKQSLQPLLCTFMNLYKVRPRKDRRNVDLISVALPFVGCGMPGLIWLDDARTSRTDGFGHHFSKNPKESAELTSGGGVCRVRINPNTPPRVPILTMRLAT